MDRRAPRYVISVDLGSDSTVVYVKSEDAAERDPEPVRLQFFLPALARRPALLRNGDGSESHRLRSRYLQNQTFRVDRQLTPRPSELGYDEILPRGHASTQIVDFDRYVQQASLVGGQVLTNCGRNKQSVLFQFVLDQSETFALSDLLPNAKLAFQSGLRPRAFLAAFEEDGEQRMQSFELHPLEMIQNQICLVLENFVRNNPVMRPRGAPAVDWADCLLVLTVPNTYSPFHRERLGAAVAKELGCEVRTITESDAIVFHYYSSHPVNRDMTGEELEKMVQQYLTIDIGKGTTDLTLLSITLRTASKEELERRGIKNPRAKLPHVYVSARTGRPSGGAKLTYIVAEYLEKVLDRAVVRTTAAVARRRPPLAGLPESPIRFTTQSRSDLPAELVRNALLKFESVCDAHKTLMDVTVTKGADEYRFGKLSSPDVAEVAAAVAEVAVRVMDPTGTLLASYNSGDGEAFEHEVAAAQIADAVAASLMMPNEAVEGDEDASAEASGDWNEVQQKIDAYVRENVDEVLIELAKAHLEGVDQRDSEELKDAVEALDAISYEKPRRLARMGLAENAHLRTHVIIAGQGSQFKPILLRYRKLLSKARNLNASGILNDEGELVTVEPGRQEAPRKRPWLALTKLLGPVGAKVHDPYQDSVVHLTGPNLKDGCAHGALAWWLANPVLENPNYIHGQIAVCRQGGADLQWLDMDELNESEEGVTISSGDYPSSWIVYYYPSRGRRDEHPQKSKASVMARVGQCESFTIRVVAQSQPGHQIVIEGGGAERRGRDDLYGMSDAKYLGPLLWPTDLPPRGS